MNNGIIKKTDLQLTVNEELKVGCYLYDNDGVYKVTAMNDDGSVIINEVSVLTLEMLGEEHQKLYYCKVNHKVSKDDLDRRYKVLGTDVEMIKQLAERLLNGETIEEFTESSDTALMSLGSKDTLMILRENINAASAVAEKTRKFAELMVKVKTAELEARIRPMKTMIEKMKREVSRLDYVIQTIETYAGIKESIVPLKLGEPAPETTPIVFRQAVIFMDEEMALIDDDFDWHKIAKFDEWLLQDDRFKEFMPDEKSMVAVKPRRTDKEYTSGKTKDDVLYNWVMNQPNHETAFLIRNGDNLYKIESEHIFLLDRMYPNMDEYKAVIEKEQKDHWYEHNKEEGKLESERFRKRFTQVAFLMQGLIDRSDVFAPHNVTGSLIKMEGFTDEQIQLRYELDMSHALSDGRPTIDKWFEEVNGKLCEGKRIILIPRQYGIGYGYDFSRQHDFLKWYSSEYAAPELPKEGIYTLEAITKEQANGYIGEYDFAIKYMPQEEFRWEERKNRVTIRLKTKAKYRNSQGILNYDDVNIDDVEYYLNSRLHRSQYYMFVRVLKKFKTMYLKELEAENEYIKMFVGQMMAKGLQPKDGITAESIVRMAIDTIKNRLKWKRPITAKEKETYTLVERTLFSQAFRNKYFK